MGRKGEKIGQCRLCRQEGAELRDSHIVPSWAYARIVSDLAKPANPVSITGDVALLSSKQVREHMLCEGCEQRLSGWENYASSMVVQEDESFPWIKHSLPVFARVGPDVLPTDEVALLECSRLDVHALASFGASVVWRASASRVAVPGVSLGPYEDKFRKYLVNGAPFPSVARLVIYVHTPARRIGFPSANRMITVPTTVKNTGYARHWFLLCGVSFHLFVGGLLPEFTRSLCFVGTSRVIAQPSDQMVDLLGDAAIGAKAKGLLARMKAEGRL